MASFLFSTILLALGISIQCSVIPNQITGHNQQIPPIPHLQELDIVKLLKGVPSTCDVNIARDLGKGEEFADFTPDDAEYTWPTTIADIHVYSLEERPNARSLLDISQIRVSAGCRIPLMIASGRRTNNIVLGDEIGRQEAFIESFWWLYQITKFHKYKIFAPGGWMPFEYPITRPHMTIFYTVPAIMPLMSEYFTGTIRGTIEDKIIRTGEVVTVLNSKLYGTYSICIHRVREDGAKSLLFRSRLECHSFKTEAGTHLVEAGVRHALQNTAWTIHMHTFLDTAEVKSMGFISLLHFNPFDRRKNFHRYIQAQLFYQLLLRGANVNLEFGISGRLVSHVMSGSNMLSDQFIYIRQGGTQFLTCYEEKLLTFAFYQSPFKLELWLGIIVSLVAVVTSLTLFTKYYFNGKDHPPSFAPWVLVLGTVFDEAGSIPWRLELQTFHRLVFGSWALMAIFLTNCYTSIMITELNAPFPGTQPETFWDLVCGNRAISFRNITKWAEQENILFYWENMMFGESNYRSKEGAPDFSVVNISAEMQNPCARKHCFRLLSPSGDTFKVS